MRNNGFTLIEVLIALAILSIALTTIIKFTSQHVRDTTYIQNKTIANWVGLEVINEVKAGIFSLSTQEDQTEMLGQVWPWKANVKATPNQHIKEIQVDVFENTNHKKLLTLTGYAYDTRA